MGDVSSCSWCSIKKLAVILRQEMVYETMAGIFTVETLSVMIQVISFRFRQKEYF